MKTTIYTIIGSALIASLAWFCFSCSEKSDATEKDKPEQTAAVNPDLAGKTHNDCLDIFYDKWQALKNRKSRQTRAGDDNEDLPPNPGDDDKITKEELEEILVETLVEGLNNIDIEEIDMDLVKDELDSIRKYVDENPGIEIEGYQWSDAAMSLYTRINNTLQTDFENLQDFINAIANIENTAKQTLDKSECEAFIAITSVMRHSMEYWHTNYTNWVSETRSFFPGSSWWKQVGRADCEGAKRFMGGVIDNLGAVATGLAASCAAGVGEIYIGTFVAALGVSSAVESLAAAWEDEEKVEILIDDDDRVTFCNSITEAALIEFVSEDIEN